MRNEIYFTTNLTENEHYIVEDIIRQFCKAKGWQVLYYRKFKNGHVSGYRECKIVGHIPSILKELELNSINIGNANRQVKFKEKTVPEWLAERLAKLFS
jgi:hypothetical protein